MATIKKIGETLEATCPVTGKTQVFTITGRNFWGESFHSYMVGYSTYGKCVNTVNAEGVAAFAF